MTDAYEQACAVLPSRLREAAKRIPPVQQGRAEEFRLRSGQFFSLAMPEDELVPDSTIVVDQNDIQGVISLATRDSTHTAAEKLRQGFITVEGGHRIGICGTAVVKNGSVDMLKYVSSLCMRIARERPGVAAGVLPALVRDGFLKNTLVVSPPGYGKTTLLRDIVRRLSYGSDTERAFRVAVADERSEIAGSFMGRPQMDLGPMTDVLDGAPKRQAATMLIRAMNPQVLALDEITAETDRDVLHTCAGCGVSVVATAHAADRGDIERSPVLRDILPYFHFLVTIKKTQGRRYLVEELR